MMLVARIEDDYGIGVAQAPIPTLPAQGALVKVVGCGLCGSDLDKFVHHKANPGSVLGHEVVGIIEALDDEHPAGWKLGDLIVSAHHVPCKRCHYCLNDSESMCREFKRTNLNPGGFSQYIALTSDHLRHTAFKVPAHVPPSEASCVEPLACVLRAIRRGGTHVNGSVAVIGLGFIGMMAAQVYQNDGYAVYGFDLDQSRLALAQQQGFVMGAFHPTEDTERLQNTLNRHIPVGKTDIVFLTVVTPHTLALALELIRDGGQIILFTSASPGVTIDPNQLYFREINLITSYSPSLEDLKDAAQFIFSHKISVDPLISHHIPLSEIGKAFSLYQSGQATKVFIHMGEVQ